ncbi:hypothetical protein KAR91_31980 [Candidatus Pacearchaeota archaeon]|nr:hypothetical protein [Candidatus Pacearchaeota archaeon]
MSTKRLVSRAEVARQAGVSRKSVTLACVSKLKPALTGKRLDIDDPIVVDYIENAKDRRARTGVSGSALSSPSASSSASVSGDNHYSKGAALEEFMEWTLRDLVAKFGTDDNFKRWADAAKVLVDIRLKDLKVDEMKGDLISRELVKTHIFGALENSNLRLLSDLPKTLSQRLRAHFKSGGTLEKGEELGRELIGSQLKSLKAMAIRVLKKKNA